MTEDVKSQSNSQIWQATKPIKERKKQHHPTQYNRSFVTRADRQNGERNLGINRRW